MKKRFTLNQISSNIFTIIFIVISLQGLFAQDNLNCSLTGIWAEGPNISVDINDNYLFINNGRYLEILDNSDPNNPLLVSKYLSRGYIDDLKVIDTLIYIGCNDFGLSILSISDINNPKEIGFLKSTTYNHQIEIKDNILYLSSNSIYGIKVIDISNPANPILINKYKLDYVRKVKIKEEFIFVAGRWNGFKIFDMSNTDSLKEVFSIDTIYGYDVDIKDDLLCIATGEQIFIYDISNISNPIYRGEYIKPNLANCIFFENMIISGNYHLWLIDINNPSNPTTAGAFQITGRIDEIVAKDKYIYTTAYTNGLKTYNISDIGNILLAAHYKTKGLSVGIAYKNDNVYLAQYPNEVIIINTSDPQIPIQTNSISGFKELWAVKIIGDYLFCSDYGIKIFDISDPENPIEVSYLNLNRTSYDFTIKNNTVYLASGLNGLTIIDITDINNPTKVGGYKTDKSAFGLDIVDNYVYLATWGEGVIIIDISDPTNPVKYNSFNRFKNVKSVKIIGDYAYLGSANFGIRIINISDLNNPIVVKYLSISRAHKIKLINEFIYVSSGYKGAYVFDIKDPENPEKIGYYNTTGEVYDMAVNNKTLYLADYETGMSIIEFDTTYICPDLKIISSKDDISCNGQCNGNIKIKDIQNSVYPWKFNWSNGETGSSVFGLCKGTYYLTFTDSKNCQIIDTFIINEPTAINIDNIIKNDITDTNNQGSIQINISGGTPGYSFKWSGPNNFSSSSKNLDNLDAGCYTLTITDTNECTYTSDNICIEDKRTATENILQTGNFQVYPNPANNYIYIKDISVPGSININNLEIEIFSISGNKSQLPNKGYIKKIDISNLKNGIYYLLIKGNKVSFYKKIVIMRN